MRAWGALFLLSLIPQEAGGQACCAGSSANQFGIVARGNAGLVGVRMGQEVQRWSVDGEGRVTGLGENEVLNTVLTLGGGFRILSERLQLQGVVPFRYQHRDFGPLEEGALGPGDVEVNLRWAAVRDDTEGLLSTGSWVPFFEPFVGIRFPTGRSPEQGEKMTQADVMGTGDWQVATGARLSRFLTEKDVVFLVGAWGHAFPRTVQRGEMRPQFQRGEELTGSLSYMRFLSLFWAVGGSLSYRYLSVAREDGDLLVGTVSRHLSVGVQVSRFLSWPSWEFTVGASLDPPIDTLSADLPFAGASGSLSLQRHWGAKNEYQ